jgi:hypothetical protein
MGLLVVVLFSILMIGSFAAGVSDRPVSEGGDFSKVARVSGFAIYLVVGLALIVPSLANLSSSKNTIGSAARIMWTLFVLVFPFAGPYIYYALYCRNLTD